MSHLFAIVEKSGKHSHLLQGLGSMQGINDDLMMRVDDSVRLNRGWMTSWEMLPVASVILTRHKDMNWASHEMNKLYSALSTHRYFVMTYAQERELLSENKSSEICIKEYEVTEQEFIQLLYGSEMMKIINEASSLTARRERRPVTVNVYVGKSTWCFTTDPLKPKDNMDKKYIQLPLDVTTDNAKDYISDLVGKIYNFSGE